ncbi:MAG TPA: hypothetical protein VMV07_06135 [Streptosporangiaceae bacterium]|nr:hypothetical protein [Streptosporangiaceae bacterium]
MSAVVVAAQSWEGCGCPALAFWRPARRCRSALCWASCRVAAPSIRASIRPVGVDRSISPVTVARLDAALVVQVDDFLQLAWRAGDRVHVPARPGVGQPGVDVGAELARCGRGFPE